MKNSIFKGVIVSITLVALLSSKSINNKKEETVEETASSFLYQNDTLIVNGYLKNKKLYEKGDFINSLNKSYLLLDKAKEKGDIKYEVLINLLIGEIFLKTNKNQKALDYFKSSLSLFKNSSLKDLFNAKELISNEVYSEALFKVASTYQKLRIIDSAKVYYNKIISSNVVDQGLLRLKARSYSNMSSIFAVNGDFASAKEYLNQAIDIHQLQNNKVSEAATLNNLGSIYLYEGNYKLAKKEYTRGISLIENNNSNNAIRHKEDLYYNLAYTMYKLKDYKAYDFQEKSYDIKDSIRDVEVLGMIEELDAKYNVDVAKRIVRQEEELKLLKEKDKTWSVTVLSISIIIILIGTIAYFKFRQKNLSLKVSRNELIQQQKIEKLKSESQIRILNATIDGKESERKQIAETLHDSVSTLLSSANLHLQACRSQFNGSTPVEIEKSQKIITEASDKIRDLSHTLVSSVLLKFGLQYSLKDMADKYSNSQIEIKTDISDLRRYDQRFEIKTYNIIQEFINNILKHSKASKAELTLYEENQRLILSINDNGQGFNKELIPEKDGLGINQIDARIKMMQGKFNIESSAGNGTKIDVELPIHEREAVTFA